MLCWPYALSSLFLAPIKRLDCRNKIVSPWRNCTSVVLSGLPFPSPGEKTPTILMDQYSIISFHKSIKNALFLEVSFTDYVLALYMFCWLYALSSLFLAPIKRLDCRNKLVSPCRDCPSVVLSGLPFPSPRDISPTDPKHQNHQEEWLVWTIGPAWTTG